MTNVAQTPTCRLPKEATWTPGRVQTFGTRHTVTVSASGALVTFVYELSRGQVRFVGVERSSGTGSYGADRECLAAAVPRATWLRVYKADRARRSIVGGEVAS